MPLSTDSTILVPVDVSEPATPSQGVVDLLESVNVVLLGYFPVPDQTVPAQLKETRTEQAESRLVEAASRFSGGNGTLTTKLVFTHDRQDPIDRIAAEKQCDAVMIPGDGNGINRILVPLRGDRNLDRILGVVVTLLQNSDSSVTLSHTVGEEGDRGRGESVLEKAATQLLDEGIEPDRIERRIVECDDVPADIVGASDQFDLLVLGETEPSLRERIFGARLRTISQEVASPTLVVRNPNGTSEE
ncbi:UspA domain protein (plasmid) [Natronomonas pharaonis DSM 2160]|uniref:UspA domain protein n=1 Tax=Natronomonas pharaonis (strain ATCC 35678 / DSM 2160 / CIP 103997 / JCM 8858 / NBRC 14720 / NCIMB 2260 / Gabara) TaxID=348780 RepID=Q3ILV9_NATPD|nr:universal stress protein [Natronomonas pharaonis]CAI50911.1 UspA domain protein [Natronomonas pharaonis DSM 2160]